jgi:small conductance mechanosensitive channel
MREVRKRLKLAFDREGIEIPFPQRTVWMHRVRDEGDEDGGAPGPVEDFTAGGAKEGE